MANNYWKQALEKAREERDALWDEWKAYSAKAQAALERSLQLDKTVESLQQLVGEEADETAVAADEVADLKLADACRVILEASGKYLRPVQIRDLLENA